MVRLVNSGYTIYMGKHSKIQPKKFSFLSSTAGLFGALVIAGGIFVASQITAGDTTNKTNVPDKEQQISIPDERIIDIPNVASGTTIVSVPPAVGPAVVPSHGDAQPPDNSRLAPVPEVIPEPPSGHTGVDVKLEIPPVGVDVAAEIDVPLLASVTDPLENHILNPLTDLLGK
jgi:hypothetical protein